MEELASCAQPPACSDEIDKVADLLLDVGTLLLSSGAHNGRICRNLARMADTWGYSFEMFSPFTGLLISVRNKGNSKDHVTRFKRCRSNNVHFEIISEVSLFSWKVFDDNLSIHAAEQEYRRIKDAPGYPRHIVLLGVGIACASLCMVAGGNWVDGLVSFFASMAGLFVRQEFGKRQFNVFIAVSCGAFVTSIIAGSNVLLQLGVSPEKAFATSVLYLVPGVPLINTVIDLIEGYIPSSMARSMFAAFLLIAIALGMSICILFLGLDKF